MKKYQKYNLLVTWNLHYHTESPYDKEDTQETKVIEFPTWVCLKNSDIDDDGIFYNVDKLSELDKENFAATFNVISAQLVRKLSIKEELSDEIKYQNYNLLVTWNVFYYGIVGSCPNENKTEEIEFPEWLRIKKSDVDNDGTFFSVEKLKDLDGKYKSYLHTYILVKAQLVRKFSIKEELSNDE